MVFQTDSHCASGISQVWAPLQLFSQTHPQRLDGVQPAITQSFWAEANIYHRDHMATKTMALASEQSLYDHRRHPHWPSSQMLVSPLTFLHCLCLKSGSHSRDLQRVWSPLFTLNPSVPPGIRTGLRTVPCVFHNVKSSPFLKSFHFKKPFFNRALEVSAFTFTFSRRSYPQWLWMSLLQCFGVSLSPQDTCYY